MSAAQACPGHFLPKNCLGRRSLRECTIQKRDNIVLIEVDSDDFGDVIILDVPESFHKKFMKKQHVISIDDDDDNSTESRSGACNPNGDAATSDTGSPTSKAHSSNSANVDGDSVSERNIPVKLCKSKQTYSGKNLPHNRYGLSSDDNISSDSDCSDCQFMGDSSGKFNEQREKASFTRPRDSSCVSPENKSGASAFSQQNHNSAEEFIGEHSEAPRKQNNLSNCPRNYDTDDAPHDSVQNIAEASQFFQWDSCPSEMNGLFKRKGDSCRGFPDSVDKVSFSIPDLPAYQSAKQSPVAVSKPSSFRWCLNHEKNNSAKELAGQCNCSQQVGDAKELSEACFRAKSGNVKEYTHLDVESNYPAPSKREHDTRKSKLEDNSTCGHEVCDNKAKSSDDQSCIITDRQKIKETDEYKRAMEEEWASRQQQVQRQAEEARRLRSRKRAEKMRIMANERRQMQRLEEIRETRRQDEENLSLKDQIRAEIKKELRKLETRCNDMSSLLHCLGIHVSGGRHPSSNEIQASYKRACLKFHPDRFGQSDLRQQVEAEEKFKLISTMKDKFLLKK